MSKNKNPVSAEIVAIPGNPEKHCLEGQKEYSLKEFILSVIIQALIVMIVFPMIHPEFRVSRSVMDSIFVVLAFIALNFIIRKVAVIFTLGLAGLVYYLSFGIIGLILNAIVLLMISRFFPEKIYVPGFTTALIGGFLLSFVNFLST